MSWTEVERVAAKTVTVLPLAAVEQHGPHLAINERPAMGIFTSLIGTMPLIPVTPSPRSMPKDISFEL
jgi:Creatinine amidohydrolase